MAITSLYFSTAAAGAGDGTSWANRAQLVNGATWSSVLTGFNFSTGAVKAYIGPGTHSPTANLVSGSFTNAPTANNPLVMVGCDSSGNQLAPADPGWRSVQPDFDDSAFPVIATTTNIQSINLANCFTNYMKFTASGITNTGIATLTGSNWCSFAMSGAGGTTINAIGVLRITNCQIAVSATAFKSGLNVASNAICDNVRVRGNGTSNTGSGNRNGIDVTSISSAPLSRVCVFAFDGVGIINTTASAAQFITVTRSVIANNRGSNIQCNSTASQTLYHVINNCMITGAGTTSGSGYGIDGQTNANVLLSGCRLDRNATANITAMSNYPTDVNNYTTSDTDANEYVSAGTGSTADFRIKNTATNIWGKGYGVLDQPNSGLFPNSLNGNMQ